MKMHHYTFYFFLLLITNATCCQVQNKEEAKHLKKKQLEKDYQEVLALIKKYKEFKKLSVTNDAIRRRAIQGLTSIAAIYEAHIAFNDILIPEKKKLTSEDQEAINEYLRIHSYSQKIETLMAHYFNCLLQEQAPQYDIHSPQRGDINIPKKCYSLQTEMQENMAKENLLRDGIEIDENNLLFKD